VVTATEVASIGDAERRRRSPDSSRTRPGSVQGERTGPSTGASVLLEIGGSNGALVVYGSDRLAGEEIEIRPHGGAWAGVHTAVRARHVCDRVLHAGVFGSLPAGCYEVRLRAGAVSGGDGHGHLHSSPAGASEETVTTVTVAPGSVAEAVVGPGHRP
jgi:hypothetical protein